MPGDSVTARGLEQIGSMRGLKELTIIPSSRFGDAELASLRDLEGLERLSIDSRLRPDHDVGHIGDDGVAHLRDLKNLRALTILGSRIGNEGLRHLSSLGRLERLELEGYNLEITDEGMPHLGNLPKLGVLGLGAARVTDAGLVPLKRLKGLRSLSIAGSGITEAGFQDLREAVPGLKPSCRSALDPQWKVTLAPGRPRRVSPGTPESVRDGISACFPEIAWKKWAPQGYGGYDYVGKYVGACYSLDFFIQGQGALASVPISGGRGVLVDLRYVRPFRISVNGGGGAIDELRRLARRNGWSLQDVPEEVLGKSRDD